MRVGVLHLGEMGISVAQALLDAGHEVHWCQSGRSTATIARGEDLTEKYPGCMIGHDGLGSLCEAAEGLIAVCPPATAEQLSESIHSLGFQGLYVDANAVSPATAQRIAAIVGEGYVDGGIIGPPAHQPGTTRLYLSGPQSTAVAAWFTDSKLEARAIGDGLSQASALKMVYAAYTKGSSALLLAVNAAAHAAGVEDALDHEWALSQPGLSDRSAGAARGTSRKAWRFEGEMAEIAATFAALGLPDGFHKGAAEIYARMKAFKDGPPADLAAVIEYINGSK